MLDVLDHHLRACAEPAHRSQRLAERPDDQIVALIQPEMAVRAAPPRADRPDRVRVVHQQPRVAAFADLAQRRQRRQIAPHRVGAVHNHQTRRLAVEIVQHPRQVLGVVVLKAHILPQRQPGGVVDAGVYVAIQHRDAVTIHQRRDGAQIGEIARRKDNRRFRAQKIRQRLLQLEMHRTRAVQQPRTGHRRSPAIQRLVRRRQHLRMPCQAQVVVRAQHHHPFAVDLRLRAVVDLHRLEERIEARGARLVRQLEMRDPREYVRAVRVALTPVHLLHIQAGGLGEVG